MYATSFALTIALLTAPPEQTELRVLFLGDNGHHQPHERFTQLAPVLKRHGIQLDYTDDMRDLRRERLQPYDALLVYANIDQIDRSGEEAILEYVASGRGYVPIHCASYCFRNSDRLIELLGGQFQSHGSGVFRTRTAEPQHPIMRGFGDFESWDETYVHHRHNERDRVVLAYRIADGVSEPWTWVRTHGQGRVFYTAWGHDQRTWSHPGFHNLVVRGILWAAGRNVESAPQFQGDLPFAAPEMTPARPHLKPLEYVAAEAAIPNYTPGATWGTQGKPFTDMQKPLPAEESRRRMRTPVGFHVELFASEPQLSGKPLCMNWDARGRLWVALSLDYPNELQPAGKGHDQIVICTDTDHDGRADKFTPFADGLSIPTSIIFTRDGAIVQDGTETVLLRDTDADDRADERQVLFSGWNMKDTHGGVSNFQYGLDNWIWAMQGYNDSQPVAQGTAQARFRMGFFRFRPDGSQLEFLRSTDNNTWGLGITEEGLVFGSTANHNPSVFMPIPNQYYEQVRGWKVSLTLPTIAESHMFRPITDRVRQVDHHGGFTAGTGHAVYTARTYPRSYWNRTAFVNGPTGHLVATFALQRVGSGFASRNLFNLVASDDEWTAPIMAEVGPDGHVWFIDWYNYIVQHNPTPIGFETGQGNAYQTPLRDKQHARIYRVVYEGAPPYQPLSLSAEKPAELVAALRHSNMFWRKHAQRLLVERGTTDVVDSLLDLLADQQFDEVGLNVGAIHALGTLHGLGVLDSGNEQIISRVVASLRHPSAGVRLNGLRVMPKSAATIDAILQAGLLHDTSPPVRLAAHLAIADCRPATPAAAVGIIEALDNASNYHDRSILEAATSAAAAHSGPFLLAVCQRTGDWDAGRRELVRTVAEHHARAEQPSDLPQLLAALPSAVPGLAGAIVEGLAAGWPAERKIALPAGWDAPLTEVVQRLPIGNQAALLRLASRWGSTRLVQYEQSLMDQLAKQLANANENAETRLAAARQLIEFQPERDASIQPVLAQFSPQSDPEWNERLLTVLEASRAAQLGPELIAQLSGSTPVLRDKMIAILLRRTETTSALLDALQQGMLTWSDLTLPHKRMLQSHADADLRARAAALSKEAGQLVRPDRQRVLNELLPLCEQKGDPQAGKQVFVKQCAKCHTRAGEGQTIGPDLSGTAVHSKAELLSNIIDPSRSVEGNFRIYQVQLSDGRSLSGLLAAESKSTIELIDTEGKRQTLLREEIDTLVASGQSLMPDGFENQVPRQELVDLLEFLTHRERFIPLDLAKIATVSSAQGMFYSPDAQGERLLFPQWGLQKFADIPFVIADPQQGRIANTILLHSPQGSIPPSMPSEVELQCGLPLARIHLLSGVSGWGFPGGEKGSVSLIARLVYTDGQTEEHSLRNGVHFADYIRRIDVPESQFAFALGDRQIRYLHIDPQRHEVVRHIQFVKGTDQTAPIVMAVTCELR